jgi:hypothetical protein
MVRGQAMANEKRKAVESQFMEDSGTRKYCAEEVEIGANVSHCEVVSSALKNTWIKVALGAKCSLLKQLFQTS